MRYLLLALSLSALLPAPAYATVQPVLLQDVLLDNGAHVEGFIMYDPINEAPSGDYELKIGDTWELTPSNSTLSFRKKFYWWFFTFRDNDDQENVLAYLSVQINYDSASGFPWRFFGDPVPDYNQQFGAGPSGVHNGRIVFGCIVDVLGAAPCPALLAAPEPSAWAMLGVGLGALGMRRLSKKTLGT